MFSLIRQASVSSACAWLSFFQCAILDKVAASAAIYELMVTRKPCPPIEISMPSSPSFCQNNPFSAMNFFSSTLNSFVKVPDITLSAIDNSP